MDQKIILKIENFIPFVVYKNEQGDEKRLTMGETNVAKVFDEVAQKLNLKKEDDDLAYLLTLAMQGDERLSEDLPEINPKSENFEIEKHIENKLEELSSKKEDYSEYGEVKEEVLNELERNQNIDILASLFELLYNVLIARTLLFATDLGIGKIAIEENNHLPRLVERMASELSKIEIELEIL